MSDEHFLSRWSRRKIEAKAAPAKDAAPAPVVAPPAEAITPQPLAPAAEALPLPAVESLTPDSDFTPFMQPGVDAVLKRRALKTLLSDPRFNVMDGLDVYIDDYSKPDPLPDGWLEKLNAYARLDDHKLLDKVAEIEKPEQEQPVDTKPVAAPADTSDAGSQPPKLAESSDRSADVG